MKVSCYWSYIVKYFNPLQIESIEVHLLCLSNLTSSKVILSNSIQIMNGYECNGTDIFMR